MKPSICMRACSVENVKKKKAGVKVRERYLVKL